MPGVSTGEYPSEYLGLFPATNTVTSTQENLISAPLKMNTEAWNGASSGVGVVGCSIHSGSGTPQGNLAAGRGAIYFRIDDPGVALSTIYVCTVSGATASATTWVGIA